MYRMRRGCRRRGRGSRVPTLTAKALTGAAAGLPPDPARIWFRPVWGAGESSSVCQTSLSTNPCHTRFGVRAVGFYVTVPAIGLIDRDDI